MEATISKVKQEKIFSKFTIDTIRAKPLLESVFKTINHNTVLPILEDVLVQRKDGNISFTSTDLENIMTVTTPDNDEEFDLMFPGVELKYLTRFSLDRTMNVSAYGEKDNPNISVKNGGFTIKMVTERISNYPKLIELENVKYFTIDTKEVIPYLEKALTYVSNDDLRPAMTGVCFKDINGMLHLAATDAHRLYWRSICKTPKPYKACSFIISAKAATVIIAAFKSEKEIQIGFNGVHLEISCEGKKLTTRLLDCKYPDFESVIPNDNILKFDINRKELFSFLRLCYPFTNGSTRLVSIKASPDKLHITGGDNDFGHEFNHSLPIVNPNIDTFAPFTFGINCKFLMQGLENSKDEYVKIASSMQPLKPIILDECVLIMPLFINQ